MVTKICTLEANKKKGLIDLHLEKVQLVVNGFIILNISPMDLSNVTIKATFAT